jgi:hypothetical protein
MLRASVPEAAIHEYCKFGSRENDVGTDRAVVF